jgi:putative endonuclease
MLPRQTTRDTGTAAEQASLNFLREQGLQLVHTNYHCRMGEIDLIMRDGEFLVFTEVRMRNHSDFGQGLDSVTHAKQRKITKTALHFLQTRRLLDTCPCRFDIVSVTLGQQGHEFLWLKNAFPAAY